MGSSSFFADYLRVICPVLRATGAGAGLASLQCKSPTLLHHSYPVTVKLFLAKWSSFPGDFSSLKIPTSTRDDSFTCRMEKGFFINIFCTTEGMKPKFPVFRASAQGFWGISVFFREVCSFVCSGLFLIKSLLITELGDTRACAFLSFCKMADT